MTSRYWRLLVVAAIGLSVAGCKTTLGDHTRLASSGTVKETVAKRGGVKLNIAAASKINTSTRGSAAPVRLKVYQLSSQQSFVRASYRDLLNRDFMALGDALVRQTEVTVKPGQRMSLALDQNVSGRYVGVVAIFNSPNQENWRVISPVKSGALQLMIEGNSIYMQ